MIDPIPALFRRWDGVSTCFGVTRSPHVQWGLFPRARWHRLADQSCAGVNRTGDRWKRIHSTCSASCQHRRPGSRPLSSNCARGASKAIGCGSSSRSCAASAYRRPRNSTASPLSMRRAPILAHPVLGPRLDLVTRAVLSTKNLSVHQIFGSPDDLKFHSSMTLFALASSVAGISFRDALDRWFGGRMNDTSLKLLKDPGPDFG